MTNSVSQPTGNPGGASALEARIERLRQTMAEQQVRLARASMVTAVVGAIICVWIVIAFGWIFTKFKDFARPKTLVQAAEELALNYLSENRKGLEGTINESADEWMGILSARIQDNIPALRVQAEDFIVQKADEGLDKLHVLTEEQFRTFLNENKDMMSDGFVSLKNPDQAGEFMQNLREAVEKQMTNDVRDQSEEMLRTAIDLNAKLEKLKSGQKLNEEQALEREILMIAKRLQLEEADVPVRPKKQSKAGIIQGEPEPDANAAKPDDGAEKTQEKPAKEPAKPGKKPAEGEKSSDK